MRVPAVVVLSAAITPAGPMVLPDTRDSRTAGAASRGGAGQTGSVTSHDGANQTGAAGRGTAGQTGFGGRGGARYSRNPSHSRNLRHAGC